MKSSLPSPDFLGNVLVCDAQKGILFWKKRTPDMFENSNRHADHSCALFNSKFAGKEAFTATDTYGYKFGAIFGKTYRAHRVIWALTFGDWPNGQIDHINGNRSDNRIENLRVVSNAENQRNSKIRSTNTSGAAGVSWNKQRAKWQARITVDCKRMHLGYFDSLDEAKTARIKAELRYGFHANHAKAWRSQ